MATGVAAGAIDVDARPPAAWFENALRIFREVDDPAGIGLALGCLAEEQWKAGDLEGAASRASEAFDLGVRSGLLQVVAESRRTLAMVMMKRGRHADAERLLEEATAAQEGGGDPGQLALILTMRAHVALNRRHDARALGPLRQALRLARNCGLGAGMSYAVEVAAHVLHHCGRAREAATLVGAVEVLNMRLPRRMQGMRASPWPVGVAQPLPEAAFEALASLVSAEHEELRVAGRSLSLEQAADLALRVLDEEQALAAAPASAGSLSRLPRT
jgi:hypothetical protein